MYMSLKQFVLVAFTAILVLLWLGFVMPWLMSAKSTIAVVIAVSVSVIAVLTLLYVVVFRVKSNDPETVEKEVK